jgi:predicted metal-dependent hydrolase
MLLMLVECRLGLVSPQYTTTAARHFTSQSAAPLRGILPHHASLQDGARIMDFDWDKGPLAEGLRLYNASEFFTAHEAWESVWLKAPEPEKTFLQGLIQVTAAFHHLRRDNPLGTLLLLQAALRRLHRYPASFGGISVELLCEDVRECLRRLESGEVAAQLVSPRIRPS